MSWRTRQALRPPDGSGVENEVAFRPGVDSGGPANRTSAAAERNPFCKHLEPRQIGRFAVKLPTDEPRDQVVLLHSRAVEDPMLRLRDDPVTAAVRRKWTSCSH